MSNIVQGDVWKTVSLPAAEMLLLVATADIVDDAGNGFWASDEYLSWKTGVSTRTVQATKRKWRESGVLVPVGFFHLESKQSMFCDVNVRRGAGGRGWVVLYRLSLDPLVKKEPWRQGGAKKVAIAATFNDGLKIANLEPEGRRGVQQKVAMDTPEGRKRAQRNKEDPLVDSSVEPSATTTAFPSELATGLREIEPMMDDDAISQIWKACRLKVPDCAADEVVCLAYQKWKTFGPRIENPVGVLIRSVPLSCAPGLIADIRKQRRLAHEARQMEIEHQADMEQVQEDFRQEKREKEAEAKAQLEAMAPEDRERLRMAVDEKLVRQYPFARQWKDFDRMVEKLMLSELIQTRRDASTCSSLSAKL